MLCTQAYFDIHDKLLIAPYVAGSSDTSKPLLGFKAPVKPIKERKTFLYLTASCLPYFYANANQTKVTGGKVRTQHGKDRDIALITPSSPK